jgi:hypothetical protein
MRRVSWMLPVAALSACTMGGVRGNGQVRSEAREVGAFTSIEAGGAYRLQASRGPRRLEVRTDANLLPLVETSVQSGRLVVRSQETLRPTDGVTVTVSTPELRRVQISGAVKGSVRDLAGDSFEIKLSGAGSLDLSGKVRRFAVSLSGAGRLRADALLAEEATVRCSGAGNVELNAAKTLDVVLSGAGRVTYHGDPKVSERISGVGALVKK